MPLLSNIPPQNLGLIQPGSVERLTGLLSVDCIGDETTLALFRSINENLRDPAELSQAISYVRHRVYLSGVIGTPAEIEFKAIEAAKKALSSGHESLESDPLGFHQEVLIQKTIACLAAIAHSTPEARDQHLELMRARFLTPDLEATREKYFDLTNGERRLSINSSTPIDQLINIIAIAEQNTDSTHQGLFDRASHSAKEFLSDRLISNNSTFKRLACRFLTHKHFERIVQQMPDTLSAGRIGGKAAGILLAYAALEAEDEDFDKAFAAKAVDRDVGVLKSRLKFPNCLGLNNSYFIGSRVFEEVISFNPVLAGVDELKSFYRSDAPKDESQGQQRDLSHEKIAKSVSEAKFPPHIERQLWMFFRELHGTPIIVRSSSELEDRFGAAFANKYESVELANSGDISEDFEKFKDAIRRIYASVFSPDVLAYRRDQGLLYEDEQMGILVQTLNGKRHGRYFYPALSATAYSRAIQAVDANPERGAGKLAVGLGEAVVQKDEGVYIQFSNPRKQADYPKIQQKITVIDMCEQAKVTVSLSDLISSRSLDPALCGSALEEYDFDGGRPNQMKVARYPYERALVTLGPIKFGSLPLKLEYIVQKLKHQLGYEVDCEFTIDWDEAQSDWKINLVQCRPLSVPKNLTPSRRPTNIPKNQIVAEGIGAVNGTVKTNIPYVLYISPQILRAEARGGVGNLTGEIIRYINRLNRLTNGQLFVFTPRRFGSDDPGRGIPVKYHDISNLAGFAEVFDTSYSFSPSLGSHFPADIYEREMVMCNFRENEVDLDFFKNAPDSTLPSTLPSPPPEISEYLKLVDIDKAWVEMQGPDFTDSSDRAKRAMHIAQDNTQIIDDTQPASVYIGEINKDLPVAVK